jgi:hypothetical protein
MGFLDQPREPHMSQNVMQKHFTDRRRLITLASGAAALLPMIGIAFASDRHFHMAATKPSTAKKDARTHRRSQTVAALRDLWLGHIFWVRNVSVAVIDKNDPAMKAAEQQAVANAQSIADSIEPFYGAAAKNEFFKLLAGHYGAVKAYLLATASGDASKQDAATRSLTSNADEIAAFLSKANPFLPKDAVLSLLVAHGGHHIQQIQQLKNREYEAEAATWNAMKGHVYQIADATADALAKQFSKRFS